MEIKINDNLVLYEPELPISWENFLSDLLRKHIDKKHGITSIRVDGAEAIEMMTEKSQELLSKEIKCIEVFTSDSLTIAQTGIEKIFQIVGKIKADATETADLYREGKIKDASDKILYIINAMTPVIFFITSIEKNFELNFEQINYSNDTTLKEKIEYFSESFEELIQAQEKKDFIELADYLEYQFTDDLSDWEKLIEILLSEIKSIHEKSN